MGAAKSISEEAFGRWAKSAETLAARSVGEPYNFHRVAPMLEGIKFPVGGSADKLIAACISQFKKNGRYTPQSIALETGLSTGQVLSLASADTEIDLVSACESFLFYHGQLSELRVSWMVEGWIAGGLSSEEIRTETEKARRAEGVVSRLKQSDGKEEFEAALFASIDGKKFEYPVRPALAAMQKHIAFYEPGDYVVVAALTGNGKTYYALNHIFELSKQGVPSCCINLENTPKNIQKRIWQMQSGARFRPDLTGADSQMRHYLDSWEIVKKMPFRAYNPGPTLPAVISTIRQDWHERRIQFAVVDYVQLMSVPGYKGGRNYELGQISAEFRALALELQIPIMVLAQFKQEVSERGDKRGGLYDIKDCSNFAHDATIVQCLYRPGFFEIKDRDVLGGREPYPENYADIFIAKGREMGPAVVEARFDPVRGFYDPISHQFPTEAPPAFNPTAVPRKSPAEIEDVPF